MTNANTTDTDQGAFGRDARRFLRSNAPAVKAVDSTPEERTSKKSGNLRRNYPGITSHEGTGPGARKNIAEGLKRIRRTEAEIKSASEDGSVDADPDLISQDEADAGATDLRHPSGPAGPSQHVRGKQVVVQHDAEGIPAAVAPVAKKIGRQAMKLAKRL